MQKTILVLLSAVAVVSSIGAQGTEGSTLDSDEPLFAFDHFIDGLGDDPSGCGGTAPATTNCNNGPDVTLPDAVAARAFVPGHIRGGFVSHGILDRSAVAGYTGTIESKLQHAQGARVFRCNIVNGAISCMPGTGTFPPENALFSHSCKSFALGTTTPGGSGNWACGLTHQGAA